MNTEYTGVQQSQSQIDVVAFYDNTVKPDLYAHMPILTPELNPKYNQRFCKLDCPDCKIHNALVYKNNDLISCDCGYKNSVLTYLNGGIIPKGGEFIKKIKDVCTKTGHTFPEREWTKKEMEEFTAKNSKQNLLDNFQKIVTQALFDEKIGINAQNYLIEARGLSIDGIKEYGFGFYPSKEYIHKKLRDLNYLPSDITTSGIYRDDWNGRVTCPIKDRGKAVDYFAHDITGKSDKNKKYLCMSSERVNDTTHIFGLDRARGDSIIAVEGYFDYITPSSRGVENVIAIRGKYLTNDQMEKLRKRKIKSVTLVLDNDEHGIKARANIIEKYINDEINFFVVPISEFKDTKDLDEFTKKYCAENIEPIHAMISKKIYGYVYLAKNIAEKHKPSCGKEWSNEQEYNLIKDVKNFFAKNTRLDRDHWIQYFIEEIAKLTPIKKESLLLLWIERKKKLMPITTKQTESSITASQKIEFPASRPRHNSSTNIILETADKLIEKQENRRLQYQGKDFIGLPQKTIPKLDELLSGLRKYILLAAAPNVGKTALAIQTMIDLIRNNPETCAVFVTLEMSREDVMDRIRCYLTPMTYKKLYFGSQKKESSENTKGWYTQIELGNLEKSNKELTNIGKRIYILDQDICPHISAESILICVNELKNQAQKYQAFIIIDYLQLFPIPENEIQKIRDNLGADRYRMKEMKTLRNALQDNPLIVISEARKPSGSNRWGSSSADVLGSGGNAYGCDAIILLNNISDEEIEGKVEVSDRSAFRENLAEQGKTIVNLKIDKGRDGMQKGNILLLYHFQENRFEETTWDKIQKLLKTSSNAYNKQAKKSDRERLEF